jgi:ornithine decarboxylase
MRTGFNGFGVEDRVIVDDEPMASLYAPHLERVAASNVITL